MRSDYNAPAKATILAFCWSYDMCEPVIRTWLTGLPDLPTLHAFAVAPRCVLETLIMLACYASM